MAGQQARNGGFTGTDVASHAQQQRPVLRPAGHCSFGSTIDAHAASLASPAYNDAMVLLNWLRNLFVRPRALPGSAGEVRLDPELFKPFPDGGWLVGGAVRDALLGRSTTDLDWLVTQPERAASLAASLLEGAAFSLDEARGHWRTVTQDAVRDYIRLDTPVNENLLQRDFTVNSLALAADGSILDPAGGLADLRAGLLLMNSVAALRADPLRLLRGVRLVSTLGFRFEAETQTAIRKLVQEQLAGELPLPSWERVRHELDEILLSNDPGRGLLLLDDLRLLDVYLPELALGRGVTQGSYHHRDVLRHQIESLQQLVSLFPDADLTLRWATLLHDVGKPGLREVSDDGSIHFHGHAKAGSDQARKIMQRLRQPSARVDRTADLVHRHMLQLPSNDRETRRFVHRYRHLLPDLLRLMIADREAARGPLSSEAGRNAYRIALSRILGLLAETPPPPPLLDGRAVMELLQLPEGPLVGQALEYVDELQAVGDATTAAEASEALRVYAEAQGWLRA
jgi:poly(A) polymerase